MSPDEIDRILSSRDRIEPASGFTTAVMEGVRRQAAEPPSLGFPWYRFTVGAIACIVLAAAGTVVVLRSAVSLSGLLAPLAPLAAAGPAVGKAALAVLASLTLARLPRLLARP